MNTFLLIWGVLTGILFISCIICALAFSSFENCAHMLMLSFCSMSLWLIFVIIFRKGSNSKDSRETINVLTENISRIDETISTDTIEISLKDYVQKIKMTTFDGHIDTTLVFIKK